MKISETLQSFVERLQLNYFEEFGNELGNWIEDDGPDDKIKLSDIGSQKKNIKLKMLSYY